VARTVVPTLVVALSLAAALHLLARSPWFSGPTVLRLGEIGLRHQAKASRMRHPAEIILLGDSTCSVGVDATDLSRQLPGQTPVLSLGLVMGISLGAYSQAAADFSAANPGQVRWIVLLLCPGKLGQSVATGGELDSMWRRIVNEMDDRSPPPGLWSTGDYLGTRFLRDQLAGRILPDTLPGKGGTYFGFTTDLDEYLTAHNGSPVDFGDYVPRANRKSEKPVEWSISPEFESQCREFREHMPPHVKLAIGLTPVPLGTAPPDAGRIYREQLEQWNAWIHADLIDSVHAL
jgi:hypothetical protein